MSLLTKRSKPDHVKLVAEAKARLFSTREPRPTDHDDLDLVMGEGRNRVKVIEAGPRHPTALSPELVQILRMSTREEKSEALRFLMGKIRSSVEWNNANHIQHEESVRTLDAAYRVLEDLK